MAKTFKSKLAEETAPASMFISTGIEAEPVKKKTVKKSAEPKPAKAEVIEPAKPKKREGRINFVIPPMLKEDARKVGYFQGLSLNAVMVKALEEYVKKYQGKIAEFNKIMGQ